MSREATAGSRKAAGTAFHDTVDVAEIVVAFAGTRVSGPTVAEAPVLELRRVCAGFAAAAANVCGAEFRREAVLAGGAVADGFVLQDVLDADDGMCSSDGDENDVCEAEARDVVEPTLTAVLWPAAVLAPGLVAAVVAGRDGALRRVKRIAVKSFEAAEAPARQRWLVSATARVLARIFHCRDAIAPDLVAAAIDVSFGDEPPAALACTPLPQLLNTFCAQLFNDSATTVSFPWLRFLAVSEHGCKDDAAVSSLIEPRFMRAFPGVRAASFEHRTYESHDAACAALTSFAQLPELRSLNLKYTGQVSGVSPPTLAALAAAAAAAPRLRQVHLRLSATGGSFSDDAQPLMQPLLAGTTSTRLRSFAAHLTVRNGQTPPPMSSADETELYAMFDAVMAASPRLEHFQIVQDAGARTPLQTVFPNRASCMMRFGPRLRRAELKPPVAPEQQLLPAAFGALTDVTLSLGDTAQWTAKSAADAFGVSRTTPLRRLVVTTASAQAAADAELVGAFEAIAAAHGASLRELRVPLPRKQASAVDVPVQRLANALLHCTALETFDTQPWSFTGDALVHALQLRAPAVTPLPSLTRAHVRLHADRVAGVLPPQLPPRLIALGAILEGSWDERCLRHALAWCDGLVALQLQATAACDCGAIDVAAVLWGVAPAVSSLYLAGTPLAAAATASLASLRALPVLRRVVFSVGIDPDRKRELQPALEAAVAGMPLAAFTCYQ